IDSAAMFVPQLESNLPIGVLLRLRNDVQDQLLERIRAAKNFGEGGVLERLDSRTLLFGGNLKARHRRLKPVPPEARGPLHERIQEARTQSPFIFAALQSRQIPDQLLEALDKEIPLVADLIRNTRLVSLTVSLKQPLTAEFSLHAATADGAARTEKAVAQLRQLVLRALDESLRDMQKSLADRPSLESIHVCLAALAKAIDKGELKTRDTTTQLRLELDASSLPVAAAFITGVQEIREAAVRTRSTNNLKQIVLALHIYHDAQGRFPPAATVDENGKPLLSWRVLILPFLEQEQLFRRFKLNEPWDSEHNKKLIPLMPKIYALPGTEDQEGKAGMTYYRVFVGNGAAWELGKGFRIGDFTDGAANTWSVVVADQAVPWTKPSELPFDPKKDMSTLLGKVGNVWQAAYVDGSVRNFSKLPKADVIKALITRAGGEVIPDDDR
ncbi:MAG: DUF1559 domain-containing protein, partial [Thermogemmata sp.]|nr:DUF1559 domain-containing protein [Thermogemmata sp.]